MRSLIRAAIIFDILPLLRIMLAVDISYMAFKALYHILSVPDLLRVFIMKRYYILLDTFSETFEMIIWFFFFYSINVMEHIYWFAYVEPFLHPRKVGCGV